MKQMMEKNSVLKFLQSSGTIMKIKGILDSQTQEQILPNVSVEQ